MREIIQGKINELQNEYDRICNALSEIKRSFDKLNNRKIELEGAMKELLEIMNMDTKVVDVNDSESKTPQRTDTNKG